jgi:hypothetical protein
MSAKIAVIMLLKAKKHQEEADASAKLPIPTDPAEM